MTFASIPPGGPTSQERFLLEWLSKEDFSAFGECEGPALTVLLNCGLAEHTERHMGGWSKVALTEAGWAHLRSAPSLRADALNIAQEG